MPHYREGRDGPAVGDVRGLGILGGERASGTIWWGKHIHEYVARTQRSTSPVRRRSVGVEKENECADLVSFMVSQG